MIRLLLILLLVAYKVPIADSFIAPVGDGYETSGCKWLQTSKLCGPFHPGVDFNLKDGEDYGDPVYASATGVVVFAGLGRWEWGNIVMLEHTMSDGSLVWSQYGHLKDISVEEGVLVRQGDQIGTIGRGAGEIYEAHLHFEIRLQLRPADAWTQDLTREEVQAIYAEPTEWLRKHRKFHWRQLKKLEMRRRGSELRDMGEERE